MTARKLPARELQSVVLHRGKQLDQPFLTLIERKQH